MGWQAHSYREPETARDAQNRERLCRSRGKHLKHSTKESKTLQTESHNALSSKNHQEELEPCTCLQGSDLIGITDTHGVSEWEGMSFLGGVGRGVKKVVIPSMITECMELQLRIDEEQNESFWVRIKGRAGTSDSILGLWGCLNRRIKLMRSSTHVQELASYLHILVCGGAFLC